MATKLANPGPNGAMGHHTAGIFADMTVDGPEIGTLVLIVDRGKNLPNRKTMGKQSAYCAARLGKEAKKTETDKRGGQTPRWDQELRYTVHDSPDYYNLKVSVFSEDKRTDLIGEAWVSLKDVIVPGGGKNDLWQGLNCKGKYAGEIRMEVTYYDTRPKPERSRGESVTGEEEAGLRQGAGAGSRVKRRPLPTNPNAGSVTPDTISDLVAGPVRAKHGPRDYRTPPRAHSMPPEMNYQHQQLHSLYGNQPIQHTASQGNSPQVPGEQAPQDQLYDEPQSFQEPQQQQHEAYQQPDFLPELPPSTRQRAPTHQRHPSQLAQPTPLRPHPPHLQGHRGLPHSHSAPVIPQVHPEPQAYDDGLQLRTDYPEPIPDVDYQHMQLRQKRSDVPPGWQEEYGDPYAHTQSPVEEELAPPPPPMHSISAPIVPQFAPSPTARYGTAPPSTRHHSVPCASPLQSMERGYGSPHHAPVRGQHPRGMSMDEYASSPEQIPYGNTPPSLIPGQSTSPYNRSPAPRALPSRHSVADPYGQTPPRPHPLSQEVPRARSPLPEHSYEYEQPQYQHDYRSRDVAPLAKSRAISPRPAQPPQSDLRPRSSYNLQHPIRAFESSDGSPLSMSQPDHISAQMSIRTPTARKTVSLRPSPVDGGSPGVPFGPDSFDVHNPNARPSSLAVSPHTPYQVRDGSSGGQEERKGPIVGWHGQEIDPSDHLPVDSWAPEPEKKTPIKTYGQGRDRDFGPRTAQGVTTTGGRVSKDTVVNFRMKSASHEPSPELASSSSSRNRLTKKSGAPSRSPNPEPLREHDNFNSVPNPYAQQQDYGHGFHNTAPAYGGGAPHVPPKVPLQQDYGDAYGGAPYGQDALSREISSIDIGSSRYGGRSPGGHGGGMPAPTAYVPVRSHRERGSYY